MLKQSLSETANELLMKAHRSTPPLNLNVYPRVTQIIPNSFFMLRFHEDTVLPVTFFKKLQFTLLYPTVTSFPATHVRFSTEFNNLGELSI